MFERNDPAFFRASRVSPVLHSEFQRHFDGCRAVVREKYVAQRAGNNFGKARRKFFSGLVRKACEENMLEARSLLGNGLRDQRMRMAVNVYPPGRNGVEDLAAVGRFEKGTFGAPNGKRGRVGPFLREWVPQM